MGAKSGLGQTLTELIETRIIDKGSFPDYYYTMAILIKKLQTSYSRHKILNKNTNEISLTSKMTPSAEQRPTLNRYNTTQGVGTSGRNFLVTTIISAILF